MTSLLILVFFFLLSRHKSMCNAKNSWQVLWVADLLCKQRVWHDMKITISYILFTKGNLIKKGSYDLYHDCHACIGAKGLYINLMHFTYLECKLQVQCHASGSLLKRRQFQTPTILWWNSQQFFMFFFLDLKICELVKF